MKKIIVLLSFICFFALQGLAQEKVYLKNQKEPIECTVTEINSEEIKYRPSDAPQLVIGVSKLEVSKIVFKSGRVQYFTDPLEDFNFYKGQKRWIAKLGLLSPAFGFTDFYLEKSVKPGKSLEFQANIIGLGKNPLINTVYYSGNVGQEIYKNQSGAMIGVGMKILRMPDFEMGNRKLMHILQGGYLKPSILVGYYERNIEFQDPNSYLYDYKRKGIVTSLISVTVGKQWILDNTFSIDLYGLIGLGVDNYRSQQIKTAKDAGGITVSSFDDVLPYSNFGYTRFGRGDAGIAIGGGIKVGYLFNWKKPKPAAVDKAPNKDK